MAKAVTIEYPEGTAVALVMLPHEAWVVLVAMDVWARTQEGLGDSIDDSAREIAEAIRPHVAPRGSQRDRELQEALAVLLGTRAAPAGAPTTRPGRA